MRLVTSPREHAFAESVQLRAVRSGGGSPDLGFLDGHEGWLASGPGNDQFPARTVSAGSSDAAARSSGNCRRVVCPLGLRARVCMWGEMGQPGPCRQAIRVWLAFWRCHSPFLSI